MVKTEEIWRFEENQGKSGKKIQKPDKILETFEKWTCEDIIRLKPLKSEDWKVCSKSKKTINRLKKGKKFLNFGASLMK